MSCQSFPNGRYAAYRHLAAADLDLVVHLGDYIYEDAGSANPAAGKDRAHLPFRVVKTLEDYRIRHAQYHLDPDLQAAHAAAPFLCVPDDHEVVNNMAGDYGANGDSTPEVFLPAGQRPTRPTTSTSHCAGARCPADHRCSSTVVSCTATSRR